MRWWQTVCVLQVCVGCDYVHKCTRVWQQQCVWVRPRRSSLRSPSGSADRVVTHKDSIIIKQKMSIFRPEHRNFLHICVITLLSRFHEEETEQGFINQHIRSLKHSCSCLHVLLWWIIILCWFTQRPDMIHKIVFRQHNANGCSITQWKTKSCM